MKLYNNVDMHSNNVCRGAEGLFCVNLHPAAHFCFCYVTGWLKPKESIENINIFISGIYLEITEIQKINNDYNKISSMEWQI